MTDPPLPPPGWYPHGPHRWRERRWDGTRWTERTRDVLPPVSAPVDRTLFAVRRAVPLFVLAALAGLVLTVVALVHSPFAEHVVGRADGDRLLLPDGEQRVVLYGVTAPAVDPECTVAPEGETFVDTLVLSSRTVDGAELEGLARLDRGWEPGAVATCPGATRLVALTGSRGQQVGLVVTGLFFTLFGSATAGAGLASRRTRDD